MECCNVREDRHFPPWLFRALFPLRRLLRGPLREVKAYLKNGMTALDAGSGPGFFTPLLSRSVGMSGKVISIDSDGRMVTAVESLAKRKNLDNVTCRIASAASMNFVDDSSVDFLISSGILCCLSDHRGAVSEIKRVLKTTGVAVISVSKHLPESDPRTVTRREWESILREFNVVHRSETFLEMRATVSLQR
ncbi:MAG: methyltransferase domain-containing protein [Candidatus Thermoplasmatota archaeon]|nr:methyltransferase domain-containing protein [Candidatus Thermoplasmatota archaeon]